MKNKLFSGSVIDKWLTSCPSSVMGISRRDDISELWRESAPFDLINSLSTVQQLLRTHSCGDWNVPLAK